MVHSAASISHPWHGIPARRGDHIVAFIECSPRDPFKVELDKPSGLLALSRIHKTSCSPPAAYGFVPGTLCGPRTAKYSTADTGDLDPLDVFVFSSEPIVHVGLLVTCQVIGAFPMVDDHAADDKLIAVMVDDPAYADVNNLQDLPPGTVDRLQHYLENYEPDHYVHVGEAVGELLAEQILAAAIEDYDEAYRDAC